MQIVTNKVLSSLQSSNHNVQVAQAILKGMMSDLLYIKEINTPDEFVVQYSEYLSVIAKDLTEVADIFSKIIDPTTLIDPAFIALKKDLFDATTPSLYDAAKKISSDDPYALATVLIKMKALTGFNLTQFEADINRFNRI